MNKEKDIELAAIAMPSNNIADAQADIVGEALKSARIDIVGGETTFFDKIVDSIKGGKAVDRFVHNSEVLTDVKNTFFNGNPEYFQQKLTTVRRPVRTSVRTNVKRSSPSRRSSGGC